MVQTHSVSKKLLSIMLCFTLCLTSFVFFSPVDASAATNMPDYAKADKYGTQPWDGSGTYEIEWNSNTSELSGPDYFIDIFPGQIYLDIEETLQSAGYYQTIKFHYGDNPDYRVVLKGTVWGEEADNDWSSHDVKMRGMMNAFNDYHGEGTLSVEGMVGTGTDAGTDPDLINNTRFNSEVAIVWKTVNNSRNPIVEKILLKGTPKQVGTYLFSTYGSGVDNEFGVFQKWESDGIFSSKKSFHTKYTLKNKTGSTYKTTSGNAYEDNGAWPEIAMNVTIYNKSGLKTQIDNAANVISNNSSYTSLISSGDWNTLTSNKTTADNNITTRAITQDAINKTASDLKNAYTALKFKADDTALKSSIAAAEAFMSEADYTLNYTQASRTALENAVNAAKASGAYSTAEIAITETSFNAGSTANAEQNKINTLKTAIDNALPMELVPADFSAFNSHADMGICYTADSLAAFNSAVAAVNNLQSSGLTRKNDQARVNSAIAAVETAFAALVEEHDCTSVITTPATCTSKGVETFTCKNCDYTRTEDIPMVAHTPVDNEYVAPTCTTAGATGGTHCSVCNTELTPATTVPMLNHEWGEWRVVTAATCVTGGEKVRACTREGCNAEEREAIDPDTVDGHNFSTEFTVDKDSTCTEKGWESRHCLNNGCNATTDGREIELKAHQFTVATDDKQASTCSVQGYQVYKCANCDAVNKTDLPLDYNNHTPGDWQVKTEEKCGVAGEEVKYCTGCSSQVDSREIPALTHLAGDWEAETEATCTHSGRKVKKCIHCSEVMESEVIPQLVHTYSETASESVASTCLTKGYDIYPCTGTDCTAVNKVDRALDPANHASAETKVINVKAATCKEDGYTGDTVHSCCDAFISSGETVSKTTVEHTWDSGKVTKEPTYTEKGEMTYTCTVCGTTRTEELDLEAHTCQGGTATCVSKAVCVICGKEYGSVDPDNHIGGTATCKTLAVCAGCGESYGELDSNNHESTATHIINKKDVSCKEDGYTGDEVYDCCDAVKNAGTVISKTTVAHKGGTATCKSLAVCEVCGESYGELNANNHESASTHTVNAKAATCKTDGYTGDEVKDCCGAVVKAGTVISKATVAHTPGEWTVTTNASCGVTGNQVKKCTVCGIIVDNEEIPALSHSWGDWVVTRVSTCRVQGVETRTCSICHNSESNNLPLGDHTPGAWTVKEYANCSKTGLEVIRCTDCGAELETKVIPVSDHTWNSWTTLAEANCTQDGLQQRSCAACGKTETNITPAFDHRLDNGTVIKQATYEEKGIIRYTCTVCGVTFDKVVSAVEHDHMGGVATCAKKAICDICGQAYGVYDTSNHGREISVPAIAATCTQAGHSEGIQCGECGEYIVSPTIIPAKGHVDEDNDGYCDIDGESTTVVYTWDTFRCSTCNQYDSVKTMPVVGWIYAVVHFFIHLIQYILYLIKI